MAPPKPQDDITPPVLYFNRRAIMRGAAVAASALATGGLYRLLNAKSEAVVATRRLAGVTQATPRDAHALGYPVDEPMTSFADVTHYNNFYEFTTDKDGVADSAAGFSTAGWRIAVEGLVRRPRVFSMADLAALGAPVGKPRRRPAPRR